MKLTTSTDNLEESNIVDRTGWPKGPWDNEPDRITWLIEEPDGWSFSCLLLRQETGHLCGYISIPWGHPLNPDAGLPCFDLGLDVHGGITYSERRAPDDPIEAEGTDRWHWFGFDCNHLNDYAPGELISRDRYKVYRDVDYVQNEVLKLATQLTKPDREDYTAQTILEQESSIMEYAENLLALHNDGTESLKIMSETHTLTYTPNK